jgi:predicted RNA-binding protein with PUA-like domain
MNYWLLKSEPTCFSIEDLQKRTQQIEPWDGVRNYQARNFMREMQLGDQAFFYHSSCDIPGVVGTVEIVKSAYPDKTAESDIWSSVDVKLIEKFSRVISLQELKQQQHLQHMRLLQKGNRLSVMPITATEWKIIMGLL